MLAVVRKPHTKKPTLRIQGRIPPWMMSRLRKEYGKNLEIRRDAHDDEELIDAFSSSWHKKIEKATHPGENIKIYRVIFHYR